MQWTVTFDGRAGAAIVMTSGAFDVKDHARTVTDIVTMKSTAAFASARQFQHLVEGLASAELGVFRDEQAAWDWRAQKPAAP